MKQDLFIHEIFPSIQGEGILVGVPQVFVRLSGCNLHCSYCDTPESRERVRGCVVHDWGGEKEEVLNPLDVDEAARVITSMWQPAMHSVSLTGGEPLLQADALAGLLPVLKREGMAVFLETNGTLGDALELVLPWTDYIAIDVKLPSSQDGADLTGRHRDFLARAPAGKVFLKMVIDTASGDGEVETACRVLGELASAATLVLQPATPPAGEPGITPRRAFELHRIANAFFEDVRVIPQTHRAWGAK
jgi:organic radical activating enzyme